MGKNGHRMYGSSSHKPLCLPDTLSFEAFKGPNYATIKEANLILESILDELNDKAASEIPEKKVQRKEGY